MTSIHDVAAATAVSTATVSRALRGLPGVSAATRERVVAAALELGYVPSPQAVGLAGGGLRSVAIVVPYVTRWYFSVVVESAEKVLRAQGYDVLLYNLGGDVEARERVLGGAVLGRRCDAVLVVGMALSVRERDNLDATGVAVATVGFSAGRWPAVMIDDAGTVRLAAAHLAGLGHRRVAYLGGLVDEGLGFSTPRARLMSFRRGAEQLDLDPDPALEVEGGFTTAGGLAAAEQVLALDPLPTAVLCASDEMAIGLVHGLRRRGVEVPREVSVTGIDDHEMARFFALTTVRQPVREQGRLAAELLLASLHDHRATPGPPTILPTEVVVRATTAPPPVAQRRA